jgi:hypothetical protein
VKSGGHASFAGASNIQSGLTIDLANLNVIQVSDDRTLTQVGAGNLWGKIYSQLDRLQLSVIGGRVAGIGVGGLTLGGKSNVKFTTETKIDLLKVEYLSSLAVMGGPVMVSETIRYVSHGHMIQNLVDKETRSSLQMLVS